MDEIRASGVAGIDTQPRTEPETLAMDLDVPLVEELGAKLGDLG